MSVYVNMHKKLVLLFECSADKWLDGFWFCLPHGYIDRSHVHVGILFECFVDKWLNLWCFKTAIFFTATLIRAMYMHVLFWWSPSPVCGLEREEQEDVTRNVAYNNKSVNHITSLNVRYTESKFCSLVRERASHNVLAYEHTNTHSPLIHPCSGHSCRFEQEKRQKAEVIQPVLQGWNGITSTVRIIYLSWLFMLRTWVDCRCYYMYCAYQSYMLSALVHSCC